MFDAAPLPRPCEGARVVRVAVSAADAGRLYVISACPDATAAPTLRRPLLEPLPGAPFPLMVIHDVSPVLRVRQMAFLTLVQDVFLPGPAGVFPGEVSVHVAVVPRYVSVAVNAHQKRVPPLYKPQVFSFVEHETEPEP